MTADAKRSTEAQDLWIHEHFGVDVRSLHQVGSTATASAPQSEEVSKGGRGAASHEGGGSEADPASGVPGDAISGFPPQTAEKLRAINRRMLARAVSTTGLDLNHADLERVQSEDELELLLRDAARRQGSGLYREAALSDWRDIARMLYCIVCWSRFPEPPVVTPPPRPSPSAPPKP